MECLEAKLLVSQTLYLTGYYVISPEQCKQIFEWYNSFCDTIIVEDLVLDPCCFSIDKIESNVMLQTFLQEYGNPFPILESIVELDHVFNTYVETKEESDDQFVYTETNNISNLIDAELRGDSDTVNHLLTTITFKKDKIVKQISKRHKHEKHHKKTDVLISEKTEKNK